MKEINEGKIILPSNKNILPRSSKKVAFFSAASFLDTELNGFFKASEVPLDLMTFVDSSNAKEIPRHINILCLS